jgi:hypothetical protein
MKHEIDVRFERLLDVNFFEFDGEDLPEKRAHERASNMRGRLAWRVNARPQNVLTVQALRVVAALLKGFLEPWRVVQAQFLRWGYLRGQSGQPFRSAPAELDEGCLRADLNAFDVPDVRPIGKFRPAAAKASGICKDAGAGDNDYCFWSVTRLCMLHDTRSVASTTSCLTISRMRWAATEASLPRRLAIAQAIRSPLIGPNASGFGHRPIV